LRTNQNIADFSIFLEKISANKLVPLQTDNAFDILAAGFKGVHMQSLCLYGVWGFEHYN
jgi:hypothetical protein